jgi:glycosyltransferase involved in cell wall biosynthesis
MKISVVINTKNEEASIDRCLSSVAWADEIVVVDMQSSDATVEIAWKFTDKVYDCEDFGFVEPARNLAMSRAEITIVFSKRGERIAYETKDHRD